MKYVVLWHWPNPPRLRTASCHHSSPAIFYLSLIDFSTEQLSFDKFHLTTFPWQRLFRWYFLMFFFISLSIILETIIQGHLSTRPPLCAASLLSCRNRVPPSANMMLPSRQTETRVSAADKYWTDFVSDDNCWTKLFFVRWQQLEDMFY